MANFSEDQNRNGLAKAADALAIEIVEGSEESDWAMWEDSVAFQDSQIQELQSEPCNPSTFQTPLARILQDEAIDPFTSVSRRGA